MIVLAPLIATALAVGNAQAAGFVHAPVHKQLDPRRQTIGHALAKRDNEWFGSSLENTPTFYAISLKLGSPPQSLNLSLDTSQGDTFVVREGRLDCVGSSWETWSCANDSVYRPDRSSTFKQNKTDSDSDDDEENVTWAQDKLTLGNLTIDDFNFGWWNSQNLTHGVVGLGPYSGEFEDKSNDTAYSNLLGQLRSAGYIEHSAYSLWLNAQSTSEGSVLFGAIDKAKFSGDLYRVPFIETGYEDFEGFTVPFQGVSVINDEGVEQRFAQTHEFIYIESDSPLSALPYYMLDQVYELLGAQLISNGSISEEGWIWDVDCQTLLNSNVTFAIEIGGLEIQLPFSELGYPIRKSKGVEYCIPGFLGSDYLIMGANILRKLYTVFDLENQEVGFATAKMGTDLGEDIEIISTGIPGTKAPDYSSAEFIGEALSTQVTVIDPTEYRTGGSFSRFKGDPDNTSRIGSTSFSVTLGGTNASAENLIRTAPASLNSTQASDHPISSTKALATSSASPSASSEPSKAGAGGARTSGNAGRTAAASRGGTAGSSPTSPPSSSASSRPASGSAAGSGARSSTASSAGADMNQNSRKFLWGSFLLTLVGFYM